MKRLCAALLLAFSLLTTSCMQVNTADAIAEIGQEYEAVLVLQKDEQWQVIQTGDKQYVQGWRVTMKKCTPAYVEDAAFSQLPHQSYVFPEKLGEPRFYDPASMEELPVQAEPQKPVLIKAAQPYPFTTVTRSFPVKIPRIYTPVAIVKHENPHRVYALPLSWLSIVAVDIPGSIIATAVALPYNIYSAIFD